MFKKLFFKLKMGFHGLFYGLKTADEIISTKASFGSNDTEINQHKQIDGVYADLLKGEETQEVKELRDETYRTLREADKYKVSLSIDDNGEFKTTIKKKTALDYSLKIQVYNPEKLPVRVIQDNKIVPRHNNLFAEDLFKYGMNDNVSIFTFERDNFIPRFQLEKYINKLVVRTIDDKTSYVDMYTTIYASQFGKVDAIFIAQLNDIKKNNIKKSDITTLEKISFVTDKAYGENDLYEFTFDNINFEDINVFDGNFVLTFKCNNVENGVDIVEKYRTKELDEKLEHHSVRNEAKKKGVLLYTAERHLNDDKDNEITLNNEKFTLK